MENMLVRAGIFPHHLCAEYNDFMFNLLLDQFSAHEQSSINAPYGSVGVDMTGLSRRERRRMWRIHSQLPSACALRRFLELRRVCRRWRQWFDRTAPRRLPVGTLCTYLCIAPLARGKPLSLECWPRALTTALQQSPHCRSVSLCMKNTETSQSRRRSQMSTFILSVDHMQPRSRQSTWKRKLKSMTRALFPCAQC